MKTGLNLDGLELTEEEAFALLGLCLTSPTRLDATHERALRKLAEYCTKQCNYSLNYYSTQVADGLSGSELTKAGV